MFGMVLNIRPLCLKCDKEKHKSDEKQPETI